MPGKNFSSPYSSSFKSAVKRGTPCWTAASNIAKNKNTTPKQVFQSLWKAGVCQRQKFNGQWIYWPTEGKKTNATNNKTSQHLAWQYFVDWAIGSGFCKPEQLNNNCGSQQDFMNYCKKFWSKQFNGSSSSKSSSKRKSTTRRRKSTTTKAKSYKFPTAKSRTTKRYRRAA